MATSTPEMENTYFYLNNLVNIPVDGEIPLYYDQEALKAYFEETVEPKTKQFDSLDAKLNYLVDEDYTDPDILNQYSHEFVRSLFDRMKDHHFHFRSFLGAYKFYTQYAMKTNDGQQFLEGFIDRVVFNALYLANGDEQLANDVADELISQRYQPATPTFLNAGKKRRGEMVSCFLIDMADSMLSIGRGVILPFNYLESVGAAALTCQTCAPQVILLSRFPTPRLALYQ